MRWKYSIKTLKLAVCNLMMLNWHNNGPKVHPLSKPAACPCRVAGELGFISSCHWATVGVHPAQAASPSRDSTETNRTDNHAHTHNLERAIIQTVMFLEVRGQSTRREPMHALENIQTLERTQSKPVLPAAPLCSQNVPWTHPHIIILLPVWSVGTKQDRFDVVATFWSYSLIPAAEI